MSDLNDYIGDLGGDTPAPKAGLQGYIDDLTPRSAKRRATAPTTKAAEVAPKAGVPFLDLPESMRSPVMADALAGGDRSGHAPTYNGMPLDATGPSVVPVKAQAPAPAAPHPAAPRATIGNKFSDEVGGLGETAWAMGSGLASSAAGGIAGLVGSVLPGPAGQGAKWSQDIQNAGTYVPRSAEGERNLGLLNKVAEPLEQAGDWAQRGTEDTKAAGSGVMGAIAKAGITNLPLLLGIGPRTARTTTAGEATSVGARGAGDAPAATAPAAAVTATDALKPGQLAPKAEISARAKALNDVGFTESSAPAVKGDHRARAVEYQMGKFDEPAGHAAAQQFADESQTMGTHVKGLIQNAGGTVGTDQSALYSRGQTQVRPVEALRDWFDDKASGMYKSADAVAQGQPVTLGGFSDALADPSNLTQPSHVLMQSAASSFAKKAGMTIGEDGAISGTALQAETVRKWMGQKAKQDPTGSLQGYANTLKDAMDDDVGKSAGGPVYDQARQLWALRQRTIADPKGISSLLDEDASGRKVPLEKVPDKIANLDQDQFDHIVGTLKNMPPELQGVGDAALGEIKSHFYNQMLDGATETRGGNARSFWNGTAVKNVMDKNSGKFKSLLSPEEMQGVEKLKAAGDVLSFDPSYPGAAAQAQNAVKSGLMSHVVGNGITGASAGIGGLVAGPPGIAAGAMVGKWAGDKAQTAVAGRQALAAWNKRTVQLKDLLRPPP